MMDGQTGPHLARAIAPLGESVSVTFPAAYAIHRVELVLDPENRPPIRIEAQGPDGRWRPLHDDLIAPDTREVVLEVAAAPMRALRVTGVDSPGSGATRLQVYELQAFTRDPLPTSRADLGDWRLGTRLVSVTSGVWHREPATPGADIWVSDALAGPTPQDFDFLFHDGKAVAFEAVSLVFPYNHPTPARVEVWGASAAGAPSEALFRIAAFKVEDRGGPQLFAFPPSDLGTLRVRLVPRDGQSRLRLKGLGLHEAPIAGRPGFAETFVLAPVSAPDLSTGTDLASLYSVAHFRSAERRFAGRGHRRTRRASRRQHQPHQRICPAPPQAGRDGPDAYIRFRG
jgi:hypothetical protein